MDTKNDLLAQIQAQSLAMQSQQKHVEKNAHKKNPDAQTAPIPVKKAVPEKKEKAAEVVREPKKAFRMNMWNIVN